MFTQVVLSTGRQLDVSLAEAGNDTFKEYNKADLLVGVVIQSACSNYPSPSPRSPVVRFKDCPALVNFQLINLCLLKSIKWACLVL